jgi:hypothetical protein
MKLYPVAVQEEFNIGFEREREREREESAAKK